MGNKGSLGFGGEQRSYSFPRLSAGTFPCGATATRGPHVACEMVFLKADPDNTGQVYIGGSNVTADEGIQLDAGETTGWVPVQNLDIVYAIGSDASQRLRYMIVW